MWVHVKDQRSEVEQVESSEKISRERAVLAVNSRFYQAFANRDFEAMDALWGPKEPIACIHPGWTVLLGRNEVMGSWKGILSNQRAPSIKCVSPKIHLLGPIAFVTCIELIGELALSATNVFRLEEGKWYLVHHHASPLPSYAKVDPNAVEPSDPDGTKMVH